MGIQRASGFWGRGPKMRAARRLSSDAKSLYWLDSAEVKKGMSLRSLWHSLNASRDLPTCLCVACVAAQRAPQHVDYGEPFSGQVGRLVRRRGGCHRDPRPAAALQPYAHDHGGELPALAKAPRPTASTSRAIHPLAAIPFGCWLGSYPLVLVGVRLSGTGGYFWRPLSADGRRVRIGRAGTDRKAVAKGARATGSSHAGGVCRSAAAVRRRRIARTGRSGADSSGGLGELRRARPPERGDHGDAGGAAVVAGGRAAGRGSDLERRRIHLDRSQAVFPSRTKRSLLSELLWKSRIAGERPNAGRRGGQDDGD